MMKLSLEIDELRVESFDTAEVRRAVDDNVLNAWSETSICPTISDDGISCKPRF